MNTTKTLVNHKKKTTKPKNTKHTKQTPIHHSPPPHKQKTKQKM